MKRKLASGRCDDCGGRHERFAFGSNRGFTVLWEHSDEARVRCDHCGYRFTADQNRTQHTNRLFASPLCSGPFEESSGAFL
jgi:hypothetical protein